MDLQQKLDKIGRALHEGQEVKIEFIAKKTKKGLTIGSVNARIGKYHNVSLFQVFEVDDNPEQKTSGAADFLD